MKITVIGGGSTYSPELVDGFLNNWEQLGLTELVLEDIDSQRLAVVAGFAKRMVEHAGAGFEIKATGDLTEAVDGADFVFTQFRVGQQPARHQDILLGMRHNLIGQETTGVGGFGKAVRTIPVVREIVETMQKTAPDAWLINFTNPSGIITEAFITLGLKNIVGLCNIPIGLHMEFAAALGVGMDRIEMDYAGLNHLAWARHVRVDGEEKLGEIIEMIEQALIKGAPANIDDMEYPPGFIRNLQAIPSPYLRYYYVTDYMLSKLKKKPLTRAQEVMEIEDTLLKLYADPSVCTKPEMLSRRGGAYYSKIAIELVEALLRDEPTTHIVNLAAQDAFPGIGPAQTVEIPAEISRAGIRPLPLQEPLAPHLLGLTQTVKAYETLTVRAVLEGSYRTAWQALAVHPLCGASKATAVLDDIIKTFGIDYLT